MHVAPSCEAGRDRLGRRSACSLLTLKPRQRERTPTEMQSEQACGQRNTQSLCRGDVQTPASVSNHTLSPTALHCSKWPLCPPVVNVLQTDRLLVGCKHWHRTPKWNAGLELTMPSLTPCPSIPLFLTADTVRRGRPSRKRCAWGS